MSSHSAVVLDTHVWIWLVAGDPSLGQAARELIARAAISGSVLIPAISVWEVAMLEARQRLTLSKALRLWISDALAVPGLQLAPLTPEIAIESCSLPGGFHADPSDSMIVATARIEGAVLVTKDSRILAYGDRGYVQVIPA